MDPALEAKLNSLIQAVQDTNTGQQALLTKLGASAGGGSDAGDIGSGTGGSPDFTPSAATESSMKEMFGDAYHALTESSKLLHSAQDEIAHVIVDISKPYTGLLHGAQEAFGGLQNYMDKSNKAMSAYADTLTGAVDEFYLGQEEMLKITVGNNKLGIRAWAKDANDALETYQHVMKTHQADADELMKDFNKGTAMSLKLYSKGLGIQSEDIGKFVSLQMTRTRKGGTDMLDQFAKAVKQVADTTKKSSKVIAQNAMTMASNLDRYGNMGVDAMARLSGAITQVGLDVGSIDGMISKFQGFESAAGAIGNLTAAFGLQLDAMEMFKLANTDQEAFFHRMREEMLAQGVAFEDLNIQQRRILKDQLNLGSMEALERFLDPDRIVSSMEEIQAATEAPEVKSGLDMIGEDVALLPDAMRNSAEEANAAWYHGFTKGMGRQLSQTSQDFRRVQESALQLRTQTASDIVGDKLKDVVVGIDTTKMREEFVSAMTETQNEIFGKEGSFTKAVDGMLDKMSATFEEWFKTKSTPKMFKTMVKGFNYSADQMDEKWSGMLSVMKDKSDIELREALLDPSSDVSKVLKEIKIEKMDLSKLTKDEIKDLKEKHGIELSQLKLLKDANELHKARKKDLGDEIDIMLKRKEEGVSFDDIHSDTKEEWMKKFQMNEEGLRGMYEQDSTGTDYAAELTGMAMERELAQAEAKKKEATAQEAVPDEYTSKEPGYGSLKNLSVSFKPATEKRVDVLSQRLDKLTTTLEKMISDGSIVKTDVNLSLNTEQFVSYVTENYVGGRKILSTTE